MTSGDIVVRFIGPGAAEGEQHQVFRCECGKVDVVVGEGSLPYWDGMCARVPIGGCPLKVPQKPQKEGGEVFLAGL